MGVGGRCRVAAAGIGRVVDFQRGEVLAILALHHLQLQAATIAGNADIAAFTLVGDGAHHVDGLVERGIDAQPVFGGESGVEMRELHHRMAGALGVAVEHVLLHRIGPEQFLPQGFAVLVFDADVLGQAFVHPADGAEHRQVIDALVRCPATERHGREVFFLYRRRLSGQFGAGIGLRLFDGAEQCDLVVVQRFQVHADMAVGVGVFQVDDVRQHRVLRSVAAPAEAGLVNQRRRSEVRLLTDGVGQVGGHLQVQHLLDEHAEDQVERALVVGGRPGAG